MSLDTCLQDANQDENEKRINLIEEKYNRELSDDVMMNGSELVQML